MKWYHFSVEYFEDLRNVNHCEFLIMRKKEDSGKYILENNLRTWSELKRERLAAAAAKAKEAPVPSTSSTAPMPTSEKDKEKEKKLLPTGTVSGPATTEGTNSPVPVRKKWGGCPNGCDHGKHYFKKENSMHAMQLNGRMNSFGPGTSPITGPGQTESIQFRRPAARRWQSSSDEDEDDPRGRVGAPVKVDVQKSLDDSVSSPDGTPSFISVEDRLRNHLKSPGNENINDLALGMHHLRVKSGGRDFGGSASGHTSRAGSDTEFSEEDAKKRFLAKNAKANSPVQTGAKGLGIKDGLKNRAASGMGRSAMADALGDQVEVGSDAGSGSEGEHEIEEAARNDAFEKSVRGEVY